LTEGGVSPSFGLWLEDVQYPALDDRRYDLLPGVLEEPPDGAAAHAHSLTGLLLGEILEVDEPEGLHLGWLQLDGRSASSGCGGELYYDGQVVYVDGGWVPPMPSPASPSSMHHTVFCDYAQYLYVSLHMHIIESVHKHEKTRGREGNMATAEAWDTAEDTVWGMEGLATTEGWDTGEAMATTEAQARTHARGSHGYLDGGGPTQSTGRVCPTPRRLTPAPS